MLQNFIHPDYLDPVRLKRLHTSFLRNKPFPYLVLPHFFQEKIIRDVASALPKEPFTKQTSDLFQFSQTNDLRLTKNTTLKTFYQFLNSKPFKIYLETLTGIAAFKRIDGAGFMYTSTDYLLPHDDHLEGRALAYTFYLSKGFTANDGGTLDFFTKNTIVKTIIPSFNTLVLFKVLPEQTFHQVSEVLTMKKRYSIAGWYHA